MKQNNIKITYINERKEYHCTIPEFRKVEVTCSEFTIGCNIHFCGKIFFQKKKNENILPLKHIALHPLQKYAARTLTMLAAIILAKGYTKQTCCYSC